MKRTIALLLTLAMILCLAACGGTASTTPSASGTDAADGNEAWPTGKLTMIVPWKSGGGADSSARLLAKYWEKQLGVNVVIENREGGDAVVGAAYYYGQPQDGNTILMMAQPFLSSMLLSGNVDFSLEDYAPIGLYEVDPSCLAVMPGSGYESLEALDAAIKANPGKIRFGVNGGSTHLVMMNLLIEHYGWDVKVVYYDGASESRTALMGGHVDVIATTLAGCTEETPIVIGALERNEVCPDAPTFAEITGNETVFATTRMFGVSKDVKENYPERYQVLVDTLKKTFDDPEFLAALEEAGRASTTSYHDPELSETMIESQHKLAEEYWDVLSGN